MNSATRSADLEEERKWAMLSHLAGYTGFLIPFGNILAPLVIYMIMKDEFPLVSDQAKEVINFQISMTLYLFVSGLLCMILIGIPFLFFFLAVALVLPAIGAVKAKRGIHYRYIFNIRFF